MKNSLLFFLFLVLNLSMHSARSQGLENFNNYTGSSGTYTDGTFIGQDGSTWIYKQCRGDRPIVSPSPCLGKKRNPTARLTSGTLYNGCGTLNFEYKQPFSSAVNLDVYVNNIKVGNFISPGGIGDTSVVHNSGPILVNISGNFILEFVQSDSTNSGQVTIDNLTWTNDTALPEPTNYPVNFTATPGYFKIVLNWMDATGGQLPSSYLVLGSITSNIPPPVNGFPVPDDPDLSDGVGALNVVQGMQTCMFTGLLSNTQYFFAIYPYTNSGSFISYKSDGLPPVTNATTFNGIIIFHRNFNDLTLSPMIVQNISGTDQTWILDSIHGTSSSGCAKMSGNSDNICHVNEDWLITPAMNFDQYTHEVLSFMSTYNYSGNRLEAKISNDYDGVGNPNFFTWTDLSASWSPGGWIWTPSGDIDVSLTNGNGVYVGFRYTSDSLTASTWELDDILVIGTPTVGLDNTYDSEGFSITPNPAQGFVCFIFQCMEQKDIRIINETGGIVFREKTNLATPCIDLSNLPSGMYFVKVTYLSTNKIKIRKLIKL
jgi:hypothetical protein